MSPRICLVMLCIGCGGARGETGAAGSTSGASETGATGSSGEPGSTTTTTTPTTSGTTAGGGGTGSGESSGGGSSGESSGGESFVIDCFTQLVPGQGLALTCNLPRTIDACAALANAPCDDLDQDGLTDAWEDLVLDRLRPIQRLDEQEALIDDATAVLGDVGRVAAVADHVRVFIMLGYSKDYGSCGGFTGHSGDPERVALDLVPDPERGPGGAVVVGAYTAAHENTDNDHSQLFTGPTLGELVYDADVETGKPRWVVFPSADKHGTYASVKICEAVSVIPCVDEDCGPDDVGDPKAFDRLPPFVNAGEEAAPRVTELSVIGFPGDQAWAMQDFCGGLGGTGCSAQVRDKLLVDPFL